MNHPKVLPRHRNACIIAFGQTEFSIPRGRDFSKTVYLLKESLRRFVQEIAKEEREGIKELKRRVTETELKIKGSCSQLDAEEISALLKRHINPVTECNRAISEIQELEHFAKRALSRESHLRKSQIKILRYQIAKFR